MLLRCLTLLSGAYALGFSRTLPPDDLFLALVLAAGACARLPGTHVIAWFLAGYSAMWLAAWLDIEDRLDPARAGDTLGIVVRIAEFPSETDATLRFVAEPLDQKNLPARIRLSWYEPQSRPALGEVWQLRVRLRRPHGYANPAGFDYEGWLFRQHIGATGYVVAHPENRRLHDLSAGRLSRFRRGFAARVSALLPHDDAAAVLLAVSVGARHRITREQWDRYALTGTIHLMAISGLHIGLAAGSVFLMAWAVLAPLCRRANVRDLALMAAVLAAAMYATVSGLAVPAQRALLMALLAAMAVMLRVRIDAASLIAVPCVALFLTDPVAIHSPGFRLSFAAVAVIFWMMQSHSAVTRGRGAPVWDAIRRYLHGLGRLQVMLLAGLFPLTTLIFGRFSPVAPLVNILILPLFNFLTVPSCLAGMLLQGPLQLLGDQLLLFAYVSVRLVLSLVSFAAALPGAGAAVLPPTGVAVFLTVLPVYFVLLPAGWPGRKLAWLSIAAALLYRPPGPPPGCLDYQVLDVGQGLAVVLETAHHTTLYDTGPAFRSGSNTAELVVIPFLKARGIDRLDTLILSHADQDHAGGVNSIVRQFAVGRIFVGEPLAISGIGQILCDATVSWSLDGVQFRFLHPAAHRAWEGNNASCVLEISAGTQRLLLTGDIETPVEGALLAGGGIRRVATVVVPHHGSRTSSSVDFVAKLKPQTAIVSAGFGNRWGFPKPDIVRRWQNAGAVVLETASSGAIGQRVCPDASNSRPKSARDDARRYWHE